MSKGFTYERVLPQGLCRKEEQEQVLGPQDVQCAQKGVPGVQHRERRQRESVLEAEHYFGQILPTKEGPEAERIHFSAFEHRPSEPKLQHQVKTGVEVEAAKERYQYNHVQLKGK